MIAKKLILDAITANLMYRIHLVLILTSFVVGCGPSRPPKPLTNEILDILSRTGMSSASIDFLGDENSRYVKVTHDQMRQLIGSLSPIKTTSSELLQGAEYELHYQAGMDPTIITVKVVDDETLVYQWHDLLYTGGNVAQFRSIINTVRKSQSSVDDAGDGG